VHELYLIRTTKYMHICS